MTDTPDPVFIRKLTPRNILSFGPDFPGIELRALNVLIGPNGCGKSNLIDVIDFMRHSPWDWNEPLRKGGGIREWAWKGAPDDLCHVTASTDYHLGNNPSPEILAHTVEFKGDSDELLLLRDEKLDYFDNSEAHAPHDAHSYQLRRSVADQWSATSPITTKPPRAAINRASVLNWAKDNSNYTAYALAENYGRVRIYRDWAFGRQGTGRGPQRSDLPRRMLLEDYSNLNLVLGRIRTHSPATASRIVERLRDLYEGIDDFSVEGFGGTASLYFNEGGFVLPASRLSDGTLRYLCLLTILLDPEPPKLVCIEEPELGIHPDLIPKIADLLVEASERMQIIVTTHSDTLVDALTDTPEAIIVCSKEDGKTEMERLDAKELDVWLEKYRLGELWSRGHIGGNRW